MGRERTLRSLSPEATEELGARLGATLGPGCVVALRGELGAGKTVLVRGLARGLGIEEAVTSPSFTLMHEFEGRCPLYHFDAWMSGREELFLEGGGAEYLGGDGVAVVEWADRVSEWLPDERLEILLEHLSPTERRLTIGLATPPGGGGSGVGEALRAAFEAAPEPPGGPRELLEEEKGMENSGPKNPPAAEPSGEPPVDGTL